MGDKPWHEDATFWQLRARFMFGQARWDQAAAEVEQMAGLLGLSPGACVLDMGCGPGRHSLEMARRGFRVLGVDRTRPYLEDARLRARTANLPVEFVEEDMRTFCRPLKFDAALSMFTSFGYFSDPKEDRRVVDNLFHSLRPGGKLVVELIGKEIIARKFQARDWYESDGVFLLAERSIDSGWNWIRNRETYLAGGQRWEFVVDHRLYSAGELSTLFLGCGFARVMVYGDLSGAPYGIDAKRLVVVAVK